MRPVKLGLTILAAAFLISVTFCSRNQSEDSSKKKLTEGQLVSDFIGYQFAIYYLPKASSDVQRTFKMELEQEYRLFKLVKEINIENNQPQVAINLISDVGNDYPPPNVAYLRYFAHGLSDKQVVLLQQSEQALILDFAYPRQTLWEGLKGASQLVYLLARKTGGMIWDEESGEAFTPAEWHNLRLLEWTGHITDISRHIAIHVKSRNQQMRATTWGMIKLGLPDVTVAQYWPALDKRIRCFIHLFCQMMAENPQLKQPDKFVLNLSAIKSLIFRTRLLETMKINLSANVYLSLYEGIWQQGDPQNRLLEIGFDHYGGQDVFARQQELLGIIFGKDDALSSQKTNQLLMEASKRARGKLVSLYGRFVSGLVKGESIQVKVPFEIGQGDKEYLWLEVSSWQPGIIQGVLKSEPAQITNLHAGQMVEVQEKDVFDVLHTWPDGRQEGNETGKILQSFKQQK